MKCSQVMTHLQKVKSTFVMQLSHMKNTNLQGRYKGYIRHLKPVDALTHNPDNFSTFKKIDSRPKGAAIFYTYT